MCAASGAIPQALSRSPTARSKAAASNALLARNADVAFAGSVGWSWLLQSDMACFDFRRSGWSSYTRWRDRSSRLVAAGGGFATLSPRARFRLMQPAMQALMSDNAGLEGFS
jgi:hypothetical protein